MKRLVCISNIDWNFSWQRAHFFMSSLAQNGYRICFINNTGFAKPQLSDISRIYKRIFQNTNYYFPVPEGISTYSPIVYPPGLPSTFLINKNIFYRRIIRYLIRDGFNKADILYSFLPTQLTLSLIKNLNPRRVIYDYVGDFFSHPRKPENLEEIHLNLLNKSDIVLTDSEKLKQFLQPTHKNVHILHNGVSNEFFNIKPRRIFRKPRNLCYFGTINSQTLDFDLINNLATQNYNVSLIGMIKGSLPRLNKNISLKGMLNIDSLANEIEKSDTIIFPYRNSDFNKSVMPAKIYQSLATGKPIVSIGLPLLEDSNFSDLIYSASNHLDFYSLLEDLPRVESEEIIWKRRRLAEENKETIHAQRLIDLISSI